MSYGGLRSPDADLNLAEVNAKRALFGYPPLSEIDVELEQAIRSVEWRPHTPAPSGPDLAALLGMQAVAWGTNQVAMAREIAEAMHPEPSRAFEPVRLDDTRLPFAGSLELTPGGIWAPPAPPADTVPAFLSSILQMAPPLGSLSAVSPVFTPFRNAVPRAGTGAGDMPHWRRRRQHEPVRGWKRAHIVMDRGQVLFTGAIVTLPYGVDARATCNRPGVRRHKSPDRDGHCTACGFYVQANEADLAYSPPFTLEVELYGTVIAYTKGWRGHHQRVLVVHIAPECSACLGQATGVGPRFGGDEDVRLYPACEQCYPLGFIRPAELAGALGCEVRVTSLATG